MTGREHTLDQQDNRRKYPRVSSKFAVEVMPSTSGKAESENISQNGLLFRHKDSLPVGTIILLSLRIPGLTVTVNARVIRCTPEEKGGQHMIAVNFLGTDSDTEKRIRQFLEGF